MTTHTMTDPGPTPLQCFLAELDRMPGCGRTKARVLELLRRMTGQRIFVSRRDVHLPEIARIARALIDAGFSVAQAKAELSARCGLGRTQARRYVVQALNARAIEAAAARQMPLELGGDDGTV